MNRKGFIGDVATVIVLMAVVAIGVGIAVKMVLEFNSAIQANADVDVDTKSMVADFSGKYPTSWDYFVAILLLGLPVVSAVLAYFLDASAVMFWAVVIVTPLLVVLGAFAAALWDGFVAALGSTAALMPLTSYIFDHYAVYVLYCVVVVVAGLFFKTRQAL